MDKVYLFEQFNQNKSLRQISRENGLSLTSVRYWAKKHGLKIPRKPYPLGCTGTEFEALVANNISIAGILRGLNRAYVGSNYKRIHAEIKRLKLDVSHFKGQRHGTSPQKCLPWNVILVKGSPKNIGKYKKRLIRDGLLENTCQICGMKPEWRGKPLVLRIDHINGIRNDHRLENLRLVCPNCDSQLPTFCSRNKSPRNG